ncbi:hypothetical protein [Brassicibacter mesophilus]|uniref:hypothetical protein n=1 Tax=Brassicibacter mesophilus TaxID=745119 RepID=UPI003D1F6848
MRNEELKKEYIRYCLENGLAEAYIYYPDSAEDLVELDIKYITNKDEWKKEYMERFNWADDEGFEISENTGYQGEGYYDFMVTCHDECLDRIEIIMDINKQKVQHEYEEIKRMYINYDHSEEEAEYYASKKFEEKREITEEDIAKYL